MTTKLDLLQEEWEERLHDTRTRLEICASSGGRYQVEVEVYDLTEEQLHAFLRDVKRHSKAR